MLVQALVAFAGSVSTCSALLSNDFACVPSGAAHPTAAGQCSTVDGAGPELEGGSVRKDVP